MINKNTIFRLVTPIARGGVYGGDDSVCVEGSLRGKHFRWRRCEKEKSLQTVAVPMERFVFRLIDIPPANRRVLAGQVSKFLPLPDEEIVWQVLPVAGRSFIMALPRKDWQEIREKLKAGRRNPPFLIPSLVAAAIYHYWHHDGNGKLTLPACSGHIVADMVNGHLTGLDFRDGLPEDGGVTYDNQEIIACGAALYNLIPHPFGCELAGRRPFPRLISQSLGAMLLLCCSAAFFFYATYTSDIKRLEKTNQALETIKQETLQVESVIARNRKIKTTADFLAKVDKDYISPYLILGDISSHLPPRTFLIDFFIDSGKGYLTGVTDDVTVVLEIISGRPYMAMTEFAAPVTRDNQGNERFQLRFEVKKGVKTKG